jgi:hypothetical protein
VELITVKEKLPFRFVTIETPEITVGQEISFSFDASKAHLF